jgi:hypothetical protein
MRLIAGATSVVALEATVACDDRRTRAWLRRP